jgi:nucleoid DNA-binding protein
LAITQNQVAANIAERLNKDGWGDLKARDVNEVLDALRDEVVVQLKRKDNLNAGGVASVPIRGLGRVRLRKTKAKPKRKGRNPATGEEMMIKAKPAGKRASVSVSKEFKIATGVLKAK